MKFHNTASFFLLFYKEKGVSSAHALNKLKRIVGVKKAGYCGTLDPLAEGLLIVAFNRATRLIRFATLDRKSYSGTMLLGKVSDSHDDQEEMTDTGWSGDAKEIDFSSLEKKFSGTITQVPPVYSAIKIKGKRACDLAREGKKVEMKERTVTIHSIRLEAVDDKSIRFEVECSSGTYIRSLIHDIGCEIGSGAVMTALTRESVGSYRSLDATKLSETVTRDDIRSESIVSMEQFLSHFPSLSIKASQYDHLRNGKPIDELSLSLEEGYNLLFFEKSPKFLLQKQASDLSYVAYLGDE